MATPSPAPTSTASSSAAPPRRPIIHNAPAPAATSDASHQGSTVASGSGSGSTAAAGPSSSKAGVTTVPVKPGSGPSAVRRPTLNAILVNTCQKGNPVLQLIHNVPWEYSDIVPDYQVGATSAVLFLSLRYHRLHPEYIHGRINKMGRAYMLRIMLVLCDVGDHDASLRELTKICVINDLTLMVAWSNTEVARYLELYKSFERKPPDLIKERVDDDYLSRLTNALTSVRGVNKTDVVTLATNFGSLKRISQASPDDLVMCPGLGEKKVKRIREAMSQPFVLRSKPVSEAERRAHAGANALN